VSDGEFVYDAFISYRHTKPDKAVADKLQKLLEKYVPPPSVRQGKAFKKMRLFRDETELPTSGNLSGDIKAALEKSRFLIVICGKTYTQSKWCMEELTYFKELHGGSTGNIITLLADGEPAEVFPRELCFETRVFTDADGNSHTETAEVEPLAANVSAPDEKTALKKLNREYLRVAAPLLGCGFDELYNRNQRRFMRRMFATAAAVILFLIAFSVYTAVMLVKINQQKEEALNNFVYATQQEQEARRQEQEAKRQEQKAVNNLDYAKALLLSNSISYAGELNKQGARTRAASILLNAFERIDRGRADAGSLLTKYTETVLDTLYYNDETLPFARIDLRDEILRISPVQGRDFAIVTTAANLYKVDINTGDILNAYKAPEGESFSASGVFGVHALAATDKGRVLLVDTLSDKEVISKDNLAHYYADDVIGAITYNETASAITVLTRISGRFTDEPDNDAYIPADENEIFEKILLTIIPCDLDAARMRTDEIQTVVYKSDWSLNIDVRENNIFSISENGMYIALKYNNQLFSTDTGMEGKQVNSDITVIDLSKFDSSLSPAENKEKMTKTLDFGFNGEYEFGINKYSVDGFGVLTVDGEIRDGGESASDNSGQRTVIYNCADDVLVFNENLMSRENLYGSGFIPISNRHYFESEKYGFTPVSLSETLLVYLDVNPNASSLSIINAQAGQLLSVFDLPKDYKVNECFIYETEDPSDMFASPRFAVIGEEKGESKNILLENFWLGETQISEFQTLDTMAVAAAVDLEHNRMLVGYKDGKLLLFNYGAALAVTSDNTRRVKYNEVYIGSEKANIVLRTALESTDVSEEETLAPYITVVSYSKNRDLMFGYEITAESNGRVYSIWDIENGNIIQSFEQQDFMDDVVYSDFTMRINSDFTYAAAEDRSDINNYIYYTVDTATAEILHTYNMPVEYNSSYDLNRHDDIFYGIGSEPDILWFFHEDILMLKEINITDGTTLSERYITERLKYDTDDSVYTVFNNRLDDVAYNMGGDYIVFFSPDGYPDSVYSLSSGRTIISADIYELESDCSALCAGYEYMRIELTPDALYTVLKQFPYVGAMTDEDIEVTGFDVWGR